MVRSAYVWQSSNIEETKHCPTLIKRILQNEKLQHYATIFGLPLSFENMLKLNFNMNYLNNYRSPFYKQILDYWYELKTNSFTASAETVRSQVLCYNVNIMVDNKPITSKRLHRSVTYIQDILDKDGNFLELNLLNRLYNLNMSIMQYNSIKDSIPGHWRNMLKGSKTVLINKEINVLIKGKNICVYNITSKMIYWSLVSFSIEPPTALTKWEYYFPEIDFVWNDIFCIPFVVTQDTTLWYLQYMIINRFFPCNYNVNTWYKNQSNLCLKCNSIDTMNHYFFECQYVTDFWKDLFDWFENVTGINLHLKGIDVLLGIYNPNKDLVINTFNYCILLAKSFIYNQKREGKDVFFAIYQTVLKSTLEIERFRYYEKGKNDLFEKLWCNIMQALK